MESDHKTNLFVITGASGAGEDSIIKELIKRGLPIVRPITTTARPMRAGESQKNPYYFISQGEFEAGVRDGLFLEWAHVYGYDYGITNKEMERVSATGQAIAWKIDFKGARKARELFPGCVTIFVKPASLDELKGRLERRGDGEEKFKKRLSYTQEYFDHEDQFDYVVFNKNGELEKAVDQTEEIIRRHYEGTI